MLRTNISTGDEGRWVPAIAVSVRGWRTRLAPYTTRTCTRCGRHTTFVIDDPAGGWYACSECGRYA